VQTTRGGWLAALHYRDFRLLLIGEVTSAIGTEMFYVALNWQMYLLTHSAVALGLLGLADFFMTLKGQIRFQGKTLLFAVALFGLATILFGLSHVYILSVIALVLIGGFDSVSVIMRETIQQLATPDTMRGRVASIAMIFWMGGPQLGEFEAGLLAALIGVELSVVAGGVATIVFVGIMALLVPTLRNHQASD